MLKIKCNFVGLIPRFAGVHRGSEKPIFQMKHRPLVFFWGGGYCVLGFIGFSNFLFE